MSRILKSYFYWTYQRGNFHYDVMVTLILLFIFVTPWLWDYGDKPSVRRFPEHGLAVTRDGDRGMIIQVEASDVSAAPGDSDQEVRKALKAAVEPVGGDSVYVERWELSRDANGKPRQWKVWAHR